MNSRAPRSNVAQQKVETIVHSSSPSADNVNPMIELIPVTSRNKSEIDISACTSEPESSFISSITNEISPQKISDKAETAALAFEQTWQDVLSTTLDKIIVYSNTAKSENGGVSINQDMTENNIITKGPSVSNVCRICIKGKHKVRRVIYNSKVL